MMRSTDEQEVRDAVVKRFRQIRPEGRIIHELNSAGTGSIRFDVACVCRAEILICEIKSRKDKLDRLEHQIPAMKNCSHHTIIAFDEKFLEEKKTNKWAATSERDGEHFRLDIPNKISTHVTSWVYPETQRGGAWPSWKWCDPQIKPTVPLPANAIHMLWRDELFELCQNLSIQVGTKSTMKLMLNALRWQATGSQITKGICCALRSRKFAEADEPRSVLNG